MNNIYQCKDCKLSYMNYKIVCDKCGGAVNYVSLLKN